MPCIYHVNENKKHTETLSEEINKFKKGKVIHRNIKISEIRKETFLYIHFSDSIFVYIRKDITNVLDIRKYVSRRKEEIFFV